MTKRAFEPSCAVLTRNKFLGARGVGLYIGAVDQAASDMVFRNTRVYRERHHSTVSGTPVVFVGAYQPSLDELLNDATLAVDKLADGETVGAFDYELPAAYQVPGVTFAVQLRTHEAGLENESIFRAQTVAVTDNSILGTAVLVRVVKLDGGGARIDIDYLASLSGSQPEHLILRQATGPTVVTQVIATYVAGTVEYRFTVSALDDAGDYTFNLYGERDSDETTLLLAIPVTGDASGPDALTVAYGEET